MNAEKKGFRNPLEFVRAAQDAPTAAPQPTGAATAPPQAAEAPQQPKIPSRRAPPTRPMNLRIPETLHDELRAFWKDTDIPMSEVAIEGIRKELARLKKQYGIE